MNYLTKKILGSRTAKFAYSIKFYIDLGVGQISWFTAKLPEVMAVVYLTKEFGIEMTRTGIVWFVIMGFVGLLLFGYVWRALGLYGVEQEVNATLNPVQHEILTAARTINNEAFIKEKIRGDK